MSPRVVGDGWYAELLDGVEPVRTRARGTLRGIRLFAASIRADRILVTRNDPGWRSLLLLRALLGRRRKLAVAHWIEHPGGRAPLEDRAARRAVERAQALTPFEAARAPRGVHIPFALRRSRDDELPPLGSGPVVAGGRAFVDWETLSAADLPDLETVCTAADAAKAPGWVRVDVPHDEFTASLPGRASVFVIAMRDAGIAQGHVRIKDAIDAGVPIVATRVRALEGVLDPGCALLVPVGDPAALRRAVDRLRSDRSLAERLRTAAWERGAGWTWDDYLDAMERFALSPGEPEAARG